MVHFWWALIGRTYKRSILFHLTQLKHDSSVNWFDALFQSQLIVVHALTVSLSGIPKNETALKFLTHNSDFPIYTTVTITLSCGTKHDARISVTSVNWLLDCSQTAVNFLNYHLDHTAVRDSQNQTQLIKHWWHS